TIPLGAGTLSGTLSPVSAGDGVVDVPAAAQERLLMRMLCGIGAVGALCSVASAGDLLVSFAVNVNGRLVDGDFSLRPFLALSDPMGGDPAGFMTGAPLDLLSFFNGVGETMTGETAAVFGEFTNGADATIYFGVENLDDGITTQSSLLESVAFMGVMGATPPDLAGFTITEVRALGTSFQTDGQGSFD